MTLLFVRVATCFMNVGVEGDQAKSKRTGDQFHGEGCMRIYHQIDANEHDQTNGRRKGNKDFGEKSVEVIEDQVDVRIVGDNPEDRIIFPLQVLLTLIVAMQHIDFHLFHEHSNEMVDQIELHQHQACHVGERRYSNR